MASNFSYSILIHYSEIALKKNNRRFFENIFLKNIKIHLKNLSYKSIKLINARILVNNIELLSPTLICLTFLCHLFISPPET